MAVSFAQGAAISCSDNYFLYVLTASGLIHYFFDEFIILVVGQWVPFHLGPELLIS